MTERKRLVLIVPAWAGTVSAIVLQRLFTSPSLTVWEWTLIFASSVFAGTVGGELENAVLGFAATLVLSALIIGSVLLLPVTLGLTGPLWQNIAEQGAAVEVFQSLFPFTLVLILIGGILGSIVAERFELN